MVSYSSPEERDARGGDPRRKILELDALAIRLLELKSQNVRVVHAHGVFDLLHPGHIRHLRSAKRFGDVLVVTLTEDRFVNKGPGRPAFPDVLRAEQVAALEDVDFVAISRFPTAVEAIAAIRPDVYIKGPDYKNKPDDVTGGIDREETAVLAAGGRLEITDDVAFSSSALLNQHFPAYGAEVQTYLRSLRERYSGREIVEYLHRLAQLRVLVVGEAILDEYVYVDQMGKSAKDPVLAMRYDRTEMYPGGALAIANHLASFCGAVELVTYVGTKDGNERYVHSHLRPGARLNFVYKADSPTIVKRRYIEATLGTKLFEVYHINDAPLADAEDAELRSLLQARFGTADMVLAADFGHGLLGPAARTLLAESDRFLAVNTQINAANVRFHAISSYKRADYVCINEGELRLDARDRHRPLDDLIGDLSAKMRCSRFLVTRGSQGVEYYAPDGKFAAPSLATTVVDRIGAGDAVLALTASCVAAQVPSDLVAFIGNVVGAQKVRTLGNSEPIEKIPTLKFIETLLK